MNFNVNLDDTSELSIIADAMINEAVSGYKEEIAELKDKITELESELYESDSNQCEC
jgi:prefoldin subunit 5